MLDDKDEFENKHAEFKRKVKALRQKEKRQFKRCYEAWTWLLENRKEKQDAR